MGRRSARILSLALALLAGAIPAGILLASCSVDHGIEAQLGLPTIRGTVTLKGDPPANTEWVKVFASRTFPPSDAVEFSQAWSGWLNLEADAAEYEIQLPAFGEYAAVAAIWKGREEPVSLADIVGIHGASVAGGLSLPVRVSVTPTLPVAEGVDISADLGRVNRGAVVRGRITYRGDWPATTWGVALGVYKDRPDPESPMDYVFKAAALYFPLPSNVDAYDYRLAVPPGTYRYTAVAWLERGAPLFSFDEIGFHETDPGSGVPGQFTVAFGDTARAIDITADFGRIK